MRYAQTRKQSASTTPPLSPDWRRFAPERGPQLELPQSLSWCWWVSCASREARPHSQARFEHQEQRASKRRRRSFWRRRGLVQASDQIHQACSLVLQARSLRSSSVRIDGYIRCRGLQILILLLLLGFLLLFFVLQHVTVCVGFLVRYIQIHRLFSFSSA